MHLAPLAPSAAPTPRPSDSLDVARRDSRESDRATSPAGAPAPRPRRWAQAPRRCRTWCLLPFRDVLAQPKAIRRLLASYFVVSVVYSLGVELYGPFLRSLVVCDAKPSPGEPFSGSGACGDARKVLSVAQAEEGSLVSMKLAVHAVAAPFLGSLADRCGRRPLLLTSLSGFAVAFLLFYVVAAVSEVRSFLVLELCFFIEGATNAFDVIYMSMLADVTTPAGRASVYTAYMVCGAAGTAVAQLASVGILWLCLESYAVVWFGLFALLLADVFFAFVAVAETLVSMGDNRGRTAWFDVACGPVLLLLSEGFLRCWSLSVVLLGLASGLRGTLAAFTISCYGWHPGDLQAYTWFNKIIGTGSLSILGPIANRFHPPHVLLASIAASAASNAVQLLSPFSPVFLFGPDYLSQLLTFSTPAQAAFLSSQFGAEKQARVVAVTHLCSNLSTSLSFAMFSSPVLFRPEAQGVAAARPFLFAVILVTLAGAAQVRLILSYVRESPASLGPCELRDV